MSLEIDSYVEIFTQDSYKYARGFIKNIENNWIQIKCVNFNYPYYINVSEVNEKLRIIL